jgi:hypothetical protein
MTKMDKFRGKPKTLLLAEAKRLIKEHNEALVSRKAS